jgi:tetratricopeptide (TPR) repeat protein
LFTAASTLYWRDAAEFQVVAFQLGIAHPAGSPLYALIAKIFTFLPFGSIAFKVNAVSAFFGALLISCTFLLIWECLALMFPSQNKALFSLSAVLAVSFYAVSNSLWHNSIVAEVYTLQNCFVVLIAFLLVRGIRTKQQPLLYLAAFLFGLSTGAHIIMILYIPALLLFFWLFYRRSFSLSHFGVIVMFVILGASIYLYLPVRSSVNPYYDWGNPETVENFISHVTDRKDAGGHFSISSQKLFRRLQSYGLYYYEDFNVAGIVLGLLGMFLFVRRKPRLFLALGLFLFSQWFFFIRYWPWSSAFIATFLFFTIGIGVALCWASTEGLLIGRSWLPSLKRQQIIIVIAVLLCITQIVVMGYYRFNRNIRSTYWKPAIAFGQIYDCAPSQAVLITRSYFFGLAYLQQCENYRLDVSTINVNDIMSPHLFTPLSPSRHPLIRIPDHGQPSPLQAFIDANIDEHPILIEPDWQTVNLLQRPLLPRGVVLSIPPPAAHIGSESNGIHRTRITSFFSKLASPPSSVEDIEETKFYANIFEDLGIFFYKKARDYPEAVHHLSLANRLKPNTLNVLNGLAACYGKLGRHNKAIEYATDALAIAPQSASTLQILGQAYLDGQRYDHALNSYRALLKVDPENKFAYYGMGICFYKTGKLFEAQKALETLLLLYPGDDPLAIKAKEQLVNIRAGETTGS